MEVTPWIYGIPVRSTWYSIMWNKMTTRWEKQTDSPSPTTKITSNLLIAASWERKCWLYAVAFVPFQIYSAISMSSMPLVVYGPCNCCKWTGHLARMVVQQGRTTCRARVMMVEGRACSDFAGIAGPTLPSTSTLKKMKHTRTSWQVYQC